MKDSQSLDEIGLKYRTDKASSGHDYLCVYETFVGHLREQEISILEIGVLYGASLKVWKDYFPKAKIVGADINPVVKRFAQDRITIEMLDQSNVEELTQLCIKHGPFDLVIEDGSHLWEHQITSLKTIFPFVKDGGIYIAEDLQTNYGSENNGFRGVASTSCMELLKQWADLRVATNQIRIEDVEDAFLRTYGRAVRHMTFLRHACIIKKELPRGNKYADRANGAALAPPDTGSRSVKVGVLAHVKPRGEVYGSEGFVNGLGKDVLQRVSFETELDLFEFRTRDESGVWSGWTKANGTAIGVKKAVALTGVVARLLPDAQTNYELRLVTRFEGTNTPITAGSGVEAIDQNNAKLCGVQIFLTRK